MELAASLGALELAELLPWHRELSSAVADLASRAGVSWPVGPADPTVALLRIVALLADRAPTTASPLAGQLLDALELATVIATGEPAATPQPTSRTRTGTGAHQPGRH